jgi:hypothetical protein
VSAAHDPSIDHQHRADRNATLGQPLPGLIDRGLKKRIHGPISGTERRLVSGR